MIDLRVHAVLALAALAVGVLTTPLSAQRQSGHDLVRPGARVRVITAPPATEWTTGRIETATADRLVVMTRAGSQEITLLDAQRLEIGRGRRRGLWTFGGVLAGALAGVVYTRATDSADPSDIGGVQGTADGIGNTIVGMVAGGAIGYLIAPQRWVHVPLPLRP